MCVQHKAALRAFKIISFPQNQLEMRLLLDGWGGPPGKANAKWLEFVAN